MAEHIHIRPTHQHGHYRADPDGAYVVVSRDEYDALIRARDIVANPEQPNYDDLDHICAPVVAVDGVSPWEQHAVVRTRDLVDRLRRAAAGTADPDA